MTPTTPSPNRIEPRRVLIPAIIVVITAFFLVVQSPDLPTNWRVWIVDLTWMVTALFAGARSLITATRGRGSDRVAFLLFGLGSMSWAIGMLIWNYHELLLDHATPFPSLADVGFLLAAPLYAAGLIAYQPPSPRPGRFFIRAGNLGMIATALAAMLVIQLHDAVQAAPHGVLYLTTALLWPALYGITALFGLFALTVDHWDQRVKVLRLLVAAIFLHALGAVLYGEQLLLSVFATGSGIDVIWVIAFALEYSAAVEQDRLTSKGRVADRTTGPVLTMIEVMLPVVVIALFMLVLFTNRQHVDATMVALLTPLAMGFAIFLAMRGWWVMRITQRIRAAELDALQRLETSERRLRSIFETASDGLLVIDDSGRIHLANPAATGLFARPADELRGRPIGELLGAELAQGISDSRETGLLFRRELALQRPDATPVPVALMATRFPAAPEEPSLSLTLHDLSEQRATEEARQRAARMAAIGQVTAGVAHDFNNLLTVIIGNAEVLEDRAAGNGDTEPLASGILAAAERCASLTRRLMAFSQQQPLRPEPVDVATVIDAAIQQLARTWPENIERVIERPTTPTRVLADRVQLEQALIDLLINAQEAMPNGGTLRVRAEPVIIAEETNTTETRLPAGSHVRISIVDTGSGMNPDELAHAFEPFYTSKPFGLGAGLGLPMAQGFAGQSGGHLALDSTPDRGTTATLWLPRA